MPGKRSAKEYNARARHANVVLREWHVARAEQRNIHRELFAPADKAAVAIADEVPEAVALKVPTFSMNAWLNSVKKKGEPRTLEPAKLHRAVRARTSLGLS